MCAEGLHQVMAQPAAVLAVVVDKVVAEGSHRVRFTFKPGLNRELPLIIAGDLPILSKAYWEKRRKQKGAKT